MRQSEKGNKPQLSADVRKVFTDTASSFPGDFANQAQLIVAAHRPACLPEGFQPKLMGQWDDLFAKYRQQKSPEELAKQNEAQWRANIELAKRRKEEREAQKGRESCRELEQIFIQKQIGQLISRAWGITPIIERQPQVTYYAEVEMMDSRIIQDLEINNSKVFISRSYPSEIVFSGGDRYSSYDRRTQSTSYGGGPHTEKITHVDEAGVGYEGSTYVLMNRGFIQGSGEFKWGQHQLTDEEFKTYSKGIKVYFVNTDIIPIDYPNAEQVFFEYVMAAEERKKREEVK